MINTEYLQQYNKFINNIIESRGQWSEEVKVSERGCEKHHILPRCLGGLPKTNTWSKHTNIIWLYPSEHFELHRLLTLAYPDNVKIKRAFIMMSVVAPKGNNREKIVITADVYEQLKSLRQEVMTIDNPSFRLEVKQKISATRKGKKLSKETKHKLSIALTGKQKSAEHIHKLSLANKGKHHHITSEETRQKISDRLSGRVFTEEHKQKIKEHLTAKPKSELHKQHLSENRIKSGIAKGKNNPRATKVKCIETGQIFDTITEACIWAKSSKVGEVCHGNRQKAGGYQWTFIK